MNSKLLITGLICIGLTAGGFIGYDYYQQKTKNTDETITVDENRLDEKTSQNTESEQDKASDISKEAQLSQGITIASQVFEGMQKGFLDGLKENLNIDFETSDVSVMNFSFPPNPENPDITYVSTLSNVESVPNSYEFQADNKIYEWNLDTGDITEIYSVNKKAESRVIGIEGDKLILLVEPIDNSPGPCYSYWLDTEKLYYLVLSDLPSTKLKAYLPNQELQAEERSQLEKCESEIFNERTAN
jgi:hypothetical protein